MPVWLGVWRAAALPAGVALSALLIFATAAIAQSPPPAAAPPQPKPVTGFVPTFEIMRTARAAGFDPLAPPLREGSTYVLRATDYRGILMRVVLDARTGAIRDVTRIVPAASGSLGVVLPPYDPPRYDAYADPAPGLVRPDDGAAPQLPQPVAAPPAIHARASIRKPSPPLPRPRPDGLAASQLPAASGKTASGAPATAKAAAGASEKKIRNTNPIAAQPAPSPPAAEAKSPAPVPLND